jgi:hypothetical protein
VSTLREGDVVMRAQTFLVEEQIAREREATAIERHEQNRRQRAR